MLFSNISIWELNYYKWKGWQVSTILSVKCKEEYCLLTLSLSVITIEGEKGIYGQFHITFRGQIFGNSLKFVQVFITWYVTISRKENLITHSKAVNIFVSNSITDITNNRVSRHSGCWISDIKYCRTWIFLHIIYFPFTLMCRNAGWWDSMHLTNKHKCHLHMTSNLTELYTYVLVTF